MLVRWMRIRQRRLVGERLEQRDLGVGKRPLVPVGIWTDLILGADIIPEAQSYPARIGMLLVAVLLLGLLLAETRQTRSRESGVRSPCDPIDTSHRTGVDA